MCLLGFLGALSKLYLHMALESLMHAYLLYVYFMACLLLLIQFIGETPSNPKLAKMCMKFNFISICTYLCGVCPIYCSFSNYFGPNEFGDHFVLEILF